MRIGFVGLGQMGSPMAACLAKQGHRLILNDARPGVADDLAKEIGVASSDDLAAIGREVDIVVTMLPTSDIVASVLFGVHGIAGSLKAGSLVIDMTSGVPLQTRAIAGELEARGIALIDAPVSGGVARARSGDLAIMVGGQEADIVRARPILEAMGSSIMPVGPVGAGQAMKALNNLVSAGGFLIGIEALLIGKKFGLDPATMVDVLNASTGMNNSTQKKFKQFVLSQTYGSGFALDLMVKDLTIALGIAKDGGGATPFAALCRELWTAGGKALGPGVDHTALARFSEQLAGTIFSEEA